MSRTRVRRECFGSRYLLDPLDPEMVLQPQRTGGPVWLSWRPRPWGLQQVNMQLLADVGTDGNSFIFLESFGSCEAKQKYEI